MITGLDGKQYPRRADMPEREVLILRVHELAHSGKSVRDVKSALDGEGLPRSVGSISNDLTQFRCEGCSGEQTAAPEQETEEDMRDEGYADVVAGPGNRNEDDGTLTDEDRAWPPLSGGEVQVMQQAARDEGSIARATAAPREPEPAFVNWKWAVLADLLKRQTTDDLNSDEATIHEECFHEVLEFIARSYDPHPNDEFEPGGSILEGMYNLVSGYLVGDIWHKLAPSPAATPDRT